MDAGTLERARALGLVLAVIIAWSLCACVEEPVSEAHTPRSWVAARIDAAVEREIEERGQARVIVQLRVDDLPPPRLRRVGAVGTPSALAIADSIAATGDDLLVRMPASTRVERRLALVEALALTIDAAGLRSLAEAPEVAAVSLDPGGAEHMLEVAELGGFTALGLEGHRGVGARIAVIDSGVDAEHPDLAGRVVDEACFCDHCCPTGASTQFGPGSAFDYRGHGTNVAGIAAGGGVVAPPGAAPEAEVVAVKVLDEYGGFCCISDVLSAFDWVLQNHPEVAVINMSFGSFELFEGHCIGNAWLDVIDALIEIARANGIVVVSSSGNSGREDRISAPACIAPALAVAATWDADFGELATKECVDDDAYLDRIACFSNLSTALDIFAPGISILAPTAGGGTSKEYEGTSQAAPQISACAALLRAARPDVSTEELEAALLTSEIQIELPHLELELPRLQCDLAMASLPAEPEPEDTGAGATDTGASPETDSGDLPAVDSDAGCACAAGPTPAPKPAKVVPPWFLLVVLLPLSRCSRGRASRRAGPRPTARSR